MSETAVAKRPEDWGAPRNKLGMWLFLCSDAMMFMALFAGYALVRANNLDAWPHPTEEFPIYLVTVFTFVLIASSVTIVKAFEAADRENPYWVKVWLGATVLLGLSFLGFQTYEWSHFITHGDIPGQLSGAENLFYGTFFTLTGFHGMHVLSGTVYNAIVLFNFWRGKYAPGDTESIELAGLYWHFVDLVWILLFTFLYLI